MLTEAEITKLRVAFYMRPTPMVSELVEIVEGIVADRLAVEQHWRSMESAPRNENKSIMLLFASGIVASGRYRAGNLGEPQQDVVAWRCDCCGRFATPTHWRPLAILPHPPYPPSPE